MKFSFDKSEIFPGTTRDYWIYVPRQYDPAKPACVFVDQDGIQFNAPVVFDNLIARGEMPVTIGLFITPGVVKSSRDGALPRFNRSYEYDGLGDNYVRFLLEELLPDADDEGRARRTRDPPFKKRKRPRDRRLKQRGSMRFYGGMGARRRVSARVFERRHLRRLAWRQ